MKILVTGAAGYIGTTLVPLLLESGHEVIALDNYMYRQFSVFLPYLDNKSLTIVDADVQDIPTIKPHYQSADVVIPLAAIVGAPASARACQLTKAINYDSIVEMDKLLVNSQQVIFPVTNSGYGIAKGQDMCTEDSPLNPLSEYAKTKVAAETVIMNGCYDQTCFRLATVFGVSPRMRLDLLVNDFTFKALRDRYIVLFEHAFKRNFIHVKDVAAGFISAINDRETYVGQIYNMGLSTANLSKLELCNRIKSIIPDFEILCSEIGKDPDKRDYLVSNEKLESTGWLPQYSLEDGIHELARAYPLLKKGLYDNV